MPKMDSVDVRMIQEMLNLLEDAYRWCIDHRDFQRGYEVLLRVQQLCAVAGLPKELVENLLNTHWKIVALDREQEALKELVVRASLSGPHSHGLGVKN